MTEIGDIVTLANSQTVLAGVTTTTTDSLLLSPGRTSVKIDVSGTAPVGGAVSGGTVLVQTSTSSGGDYYTIGVLDVPPDASKVSAVFDIPSLGTTLLRCRMRAGASDIVFYILAVAGGS